MSPTASGTKAIVWAAGSGIVKGVNETTFAPNSPITREQIAVILYRYAHEEGTPGTASSRASPTQRTSPATRWGHELGGRQSLINSSDGKLLPQVTATRAQIAVILARYLNA